MTASRGGSPSSPHTERVATFSAAASAASAISDRCAPTVGERQHRLVLHGRREVQAGEHQQPVAVERSQRRHAHRLCQLPIRRRVGRTRCAVRRPTASVTSPASRCQDCGLATRWSPSASDEPSTPNSRPRSALVLDQRLVEFVPVLRRAPRPAAPSSRSAASASGARDSDHSSSTCASVFQPSRSRSAGADGSTSPSRPTLGSFGRCVAGLATATTVSHARRANHRSATATGRSSARTA